MIYSQMQKTCLLDSNVKNLETARMYIVVFSDKYEHAKG